mgnify:CR=1 FL=1
MNYKPLQIGDLIAERPIVQGGMGVGISLGNLAGAVAKEGGVGIISSAQIGFKEEDFENNPRLANKKAIKKEYEKARRISPNGIIGFNIMVALKDYREHVIEAAKAGADIIVSGAGLPTELPEYLKGFKTKMAPIVSSVKSAKVILKYWDRRHNATADMIIIEGPKAGGHLGFSVEELESELDYDHEIQGIIDVVKEYEKKYNKDIPVVVAGGISDKNKVKHAFDLGAQGVQVATRFVPTKECDADENYKKEKVKKHCSVVVIGAGTAGLEAACTAAEVGCTTFLLEKKDVLGGLATEISKIPAKHRLNDFPVYLQRRAAALDNLYIFKNVEATLEVIEKFNPHIIICATGSAPLLPPISGLHENIDKEGGKVESILSMIKHVPDYPEDMTGQKVVVIGGGAVGLDVVEFFAPRGAEVSIVEMMPAIGRDLDPVTKNDTKCMMEKYNVNQLTSTALQEVKEDCFVVKSPEGEVYELPFDHGFVCLGMRAQSKVYEEVSKAYKDTNVRVENIGDSVRARRIIDGTFEGRNIVFTLEQKGFL